MKTDGDSRITLTRRTRRMRTHGTVLLALLIATASCGDSTTAPKDTLALTAAQAAAIVGKAQQISVTNPELSWLGDSIEVVIKSGAEAQRIAVTVDSVAKSYYALSLVRQIITANSFTTFHLIGFDDASNPTDFVVANGYAPGSSFTPPTSVTGSFGSINAFAHVIHVSGATVRDWAAQTGTAHFEIASTGATCAGSASIECNSVLLVAEADATALRPEANPADVHSASFASVTVPGVLMTFH